MDQELQTEMHSRQPVDMHVDTDTSRHFEMMPDQQSGSITRCTFTSRTILSNFILSWFQMT